jgi:hypothetical protein
MNRRVRFSDPRSAFDHDAQVDGDDSGMANFTAGGVGQPWLRSGIPPWHMWGSSQSIALNAYFSDTPPVSTPGQIVKVAYKRPETWHFLLGARIIDAPAMINNDAAITINFDVVTGIGRSQQQMPTFMSLNWKWISGTATPVQAPTTIIWTTRARSPATGYILSGGLFIPDPATIRDVNDIVGQDIQVTCRADLYMRGVNEGDRTTANVEVSAFFAPKTHVRPDWYLTAPPEVLFGGDEIAGK